MLKVLIFTILFIGILFLVFYLRQVLLMRQVGGMRKKYKVLADYLLGLDKQYKVLAETNFSLCIGCPTSHRTFFKDCNSGGVNLGNPFSKSFSSMALS